MGLIRGRGPRSSPPALHIGCGAVSLPGWVNIDRVSQRGVDLVADVTEGLDFADGSVAAIFAEHFLEHLRLQDALRFLQEARRVLAADGWMRLSTPNLDWVWASHYTLDADTDRRVLGCFALNRAFHAWGHRFLWNRSLLGEALAACGFTGIRWCAYGTSELPRFQGIERHEAYGDTAEMPHVLIVEATPGAADPRRLTRLRARVERELLRHLEPVDRP